MATQSPIVRKRRLGAVLRKMREHKGITLEEVARKMECSQSKISRIETGHSSVTTRDVRDLLAIYGVTGRDADDLIAIAREARERGWWHPYTNVLVSAYVGMETDAREIQTYEHQIVPGLLQTPEYAESLLRSGRIGAQEEEIFSRVSVRMARQSLMTRHENPVSFKAVLDEAVLSRPVGSSEIMYAQFRRLCEAMKLPNVTIQVLPFVAGAHAAMEGTFAILDFTSPEDSSMVYAENATGGLFLEKPEELQKYRQIFKSVQEMALSPEESAELIAYLAEEPIWKSRTRVSTRDTSSI